MAPPGRRRGSAGRCARAAARATSGDRTGWRGLWRAREKGHLCPRSARHDVAGRAIRTAAATMVRADAIAPTCEALRCAARRVQASSSTRIAGSAATALTPPLCALHAEREQAHRQGAGRPDARPACQLQRWPGGGQPRLVHVAGDADGPAREPLRRRRLHSGPALPAGLPLQAAQGAGRGARKANAAQLRVFIRLRRCAAGAVPHQDLPPQRQQSGAQSRALSRAWRRAEPRR